MKKAKPSGKVPKELAVKPSAAPATALGRTSRTASRTDHPERGAAIARPGLIGFRAGQRLFQLLAIFRSHSVSTPELWTFLFADLRNGEIRLARRTSHHGVLPIFGEHPNPVLNECVQA